MSQTIILHKQLSYTVVGCAQRVHTALGPGFPESVYQKALGHELVNAKIPFQAQAGFEATYDGVCVASSEWTSVWMRRLFWR